MIAAVDVPLGILGDVAFTWRDVPTTWGEVAAFVTGALGVWLVARQHVANWPIGIADAAFFLLLFAKYGHYADSGLQLVYIGLGAYGWWAWLHGGAERTELAVRATDSNGLTLTAGLYVVFAVLCERRVSDALAAIDELRDDAPAWRFADPLQPRIREVAAP